MSETETNPPPVPATDAVTESTPPPSSTAQADPPMATEGAQPGAGDTVQSIAVAAVESATPAVAPHASPVDSAQLLKQLFPALFAGAVKPLKLRIQVDIQARAPGRFSKQALSAFFRRHTGSTSYLIAVSKAPHRYDLDGQPAGEISAEHRQVALDELGRRREMQQSRRDLEEQQRRNRAGLLHDFQSTTLTKANFCALKGVPVDELEGLLEMARAEAVERAQQAPPQRPNGGRGPGQDRPRRDGGRGSRGPGEVPRRPR
jgi:hypothetical protein